MASKSAYDDEMDVGSKIFPQLLMEILKDDRNHHAISFLEHGRAFIVKDRSLFIETVMPRYFSRKAKYSSFTRKLNRWYVFSLRRRDYDVATGFCVLTLAIIFIGISVA